MADRGEVTELVRRVVTELELTHDEVPGGLTVTLPGVRKLQTECAVMVNRHDLEVRAFVARHPDENAEGVFAWLLQRNLRLQGIAFCVDRLRDIHLVGRLPLSAVTEETVDQLLGAVASTADESFNTILELGFASSIRAEWAWRLSRGESTRNLEAFQHLRPRD